MLKRKGSVCHGGTERKTQSTWKAAVPVYNFLPLPPLKVSFLYLPCLAYIRSVLAFIQICHKKCPGGHLGRAARDAGEWVSSRGIRPVPQMKMVYVTVLGVVFAQQQGTFQSEFL